MNQPGAAAQPVDAGDSGQRDRGARLLASLDTQLRCFVQLVSPLAPLVGTEELRQELVVSLLTSAACGRGLTAPALLARAGAHLITWATAEEAFRELPRLGVGLLHDADLAPITPPPMRRIHPRWPRSAAVATKETTNA
jgi:hypothetical protein